MRKTMSTLCTVGALVALGAVAQPAAADDPNARTTTNDYGNGVIATCKAPNKTGVAGEYGAWGHYIDGCTVTVTCPAHLQVCEAAPESRIGTQVYRGHRVTLNSRTRAFLNSGTEIWHRDVSCDNTDWCRAEDDVINIRGGQHASVQCNGVRESAQNRANVTCSVDLRYKY